MISVFWVGQFEKTGFHDKGELMNRIGIPTYAGLFAFCYGVHPVFPTSVNSITDRHQFYR